MDNEKLWTKDFLSISLINFFCMLIYFALYVPMSSYAADRFQATASEAGLATGIFIIGTLTGRIITGKVIEVIGRKNVLVIGLFLLICTTFLHFIEVGLFFLNIVRFINGIAMGAATNAAATLAAQVIPAKRKGEGIGFFSLSTVLSIAFGPLIGLSLSGRFGFTSIFVFSAASGLISLLLALLLRVKPVQFAVSPQGSKKWFNLSNYIEYKALPICLITMVATFAYSSVFSFMPMYAAELNMVEAAGFYFVAYSVVVLISRPLAGRLFDTKGANAFMYPVFVVFAAGMLVIGIASHEAYIILAGVLFGIGFGNLLTGTQAIAIKVTPPQRFGLATSTFYILGDLGYGFGPLVLGYLLPITGFRGLYLSLIGVIFLCAVMYYALHGKKEKEMSALPSH